MPQKPENINNFLNIPIKATITKKQNENKYTLHLEKYGNKYHGLHIRLTEEHIKNLCWWY